MLADALHSATLGDPSDFGEWRDVARGLVSAGIAPDRIAWGDSAGTGADLFAGHDRTLPAANGQVRASRVFLDLGESAVLHSDPARHALLYRLLWRLQARPNLMRDATDSDVRQVQQLARQVRRDIHKMRAFVRFRRIEEADGGERYVAWFEPDHHILRANARFFLNRFAAMRWSILTPRGSLHWDGETLGEGPPARRADAPAEDATEALWQSYYAAIFNPARLKIGAMVKEMPRRYWKNLPEAALIPSLVAGARQREIAMVADGQDRFDAERRPGSLAALAEGIIACRRCPIGCNGTRAVAGEGASHAPLMIVGEQPGDMEERARRPFVGPAGQLLDEHLEKAGIDRARAYVTNAVKHFKYQPRGKRRLHQNPTVGEIDTCRWWLESELALVTPRIVLALGASAARGILGKTVSIKAVRGEPIDLPEGRLLFVTTHPSYLLRLPPDARPREEERFAEDLAHVSRLVRS